MMRVVVPMALAGCIACSSFDPQATPPNPQRCQNADSNPARNVSFKDDIRPMMDRYAFDPLGPGCKQCHYPGGGDQAWPELGLIEGQLDLSTLGGLRKGGRTSGIYGIIDTDEPCKSAIVQKLLGTYTIALERMPYRSARWWRPSEVQLVIDWIAEGARGGDDE